MFTLQEKYVTIYIDMYKKGGLVKSNMKSKKKKILFIVVTSLILLLMMFSSAENIVKSLSVSQPNEANLIGETEGTYYISTNDENMCKYLSDIEYDKEQSSAGWGSITLDSNLENQYNHGLITLMINGEKKYFLKGISAHAKSTLIYNISGYDYDYFSAYVGVDESRGNNGNGVKFSIYTSEDGSTWNLKTSTTQALKGNSNAEFIQIRLEGAKYLKLYCDEIGSNSSDHSVYADAKLYKEGFTEKQPENVDFIKTVEQYDAELANVDLNQQINDKELTLLQRTFVNNVGYDLLIAIVNQNEDYKEAVKWLMEDIENLRLYVLGGAPDGGSYYNSIKELSRLYKAYKDDFTNKTKTNNTWYPDLTKGEVYKKMAISLSLTHATKVGYWAQIDHPKNRSDSVVRYQIYKDLYDNGKFKVSERQDQTKWYEALTVEEMRYVMNNITDDEELKWLNAYTQKRIDEHPNEEEKYLQPHTYIAYVWPDFENPIFHDPNRKEYWDKVFEGIFSEYGVTYSTENDHVYKAWMSMRNEFGTGAVCGGISKLGCHIRAAHGTPASVIGQPGHAAIIYYRKTESGKGYWSMDNDVSGWAQSGKSEKLGTRMPLGWGNDSYVDGYAATYIILSQDAINDNVNYEKAEKIIMTADLYEGNVAKQEAIYEEALKVQEINIDAWWGLINAYKADNTKTEEDYYKLAERLGKALMPYPLPMKNLLDQIGEKLTSVKYSFEFTILETKLLNDGKNYSKEDRKIEPDISGITRTVASYLLGQTDTSLASFSFDGANAGKIILASRYDDVGVRWDYSLNGGASWKEVSFTAEAPHKWQLTKNEIEKITSENDILIHIVGTDYKDSNIYRIDIEEQSALDNLYANDLENRIVGVNLDTYWRYNVGDDWTSYSVASPDLSGNKTVQIRQGATGTKLASPASEMYKFTEDNQPDTRKYVMVSNLKIKGYPENENNEGYSSQSIDSSRPFYAPNAIDGNLYTMWHTDFRYNVIDQGIKPYITIELNSPKWISAVEFIQRKYKWNDPDYIKNAIVYVSMDGSSWTEAARINDCPKDTELRKVEFDQSMNAKYVKIELETYDMFASIAMLNLFEDVTKIDRTKPTAEIYYSTTERTSGYVIARLVNPSTEITITNNDGNDTYVFKEDGTFTFYFEDKNGNKGEATAEVNWIDKDSPTADVDYKLDGDKKLRILLDNISEDVYLLDKNDNKISYVEVKDKKVSKLSFLDESGNVYKESELDADGNVTKNIYKNTKTKEVPQVATYVVTYANDEVIEEQFLDENGVSVNVTSAEKEILRTLQQIKTNPLEYTFEDSGDYEFRLLDKANNIAYKSIKVDYLEDGNVIASDISYDITKLTNQNVVATINPYIVNVNDKDAKPTVTIINNNSSKEYTFDDNKEFTFEYKDSSDIGNAKIQRHQAKVYWIDKQNPTAQIKYSTTESTNGPVTVKLTDESENIMVTNNNTSKEYTFTKNGTFTFEFEDEAGNQGRAIATVNNIQEEQDTPSDSFKTNLKLDNSTVKRGDNITVTISLSNTAIERGEKGISAYSAKLDFDSSVLEYVSAEGNDNWEKPVYKEKSIAGNTKDGKAVNTEQDIATITFKVKDDAKLGETIIKLVDFSGSTEEADVTAEDSSITLKVVEKDNINGEGSGSGSVNPNGDSSQSGNTDNGNNSNNGIDKDSKWPTKLPQTGASNILIDIAIVVLLVVAINFAIKLRLINKKMKKQ